MEGNGHLIRRVEIQVVMELYEPRERSNHVTTLLAVTSGSRNIINLYYA